MPVWGGVRTLNYRARDRSLCRPIMILCLVMACGYVRAETAGTVVVADGEVEIYSPVSKSWRRARAGDTLDRGDTIRTGADGRVGVLLADETQLRLNRNTRFAFTRVAAAAGWRRVRGLVPTGIKGARSLYRLLDGEAWLRNKNPGTAIEIEAGLTRATLDGTELNISLDASGVVEITVLEGAVRAGNPLGEAVASSGEMIVSSPEQAPVTRVLMTPDDAVQWTLTLPPIERLVITTDPATRRALSELASGQVGTAYADLRRQAEQQPDAPDVAGALAIAALMANRPDEAAGAANRATELTPESASAWLIAAYAARANFDLEKAEATVREALIREPDNVAALLLLAELEFGSDRIELARASLASARALAPENAAVWNLEGFIRLAARQTGAALAAFERAIELDSGLADAYMGRALGQMRQGETDRALASIGTAAVLEPQRSLYLSYWGKMLHQLGRHEEALIMLERAHTLDDRDPTPLFYQSIILENLNRPGEALIALNQAVVLNDNRAVYRSRYLLDQDLAARNVDLAISYDALGLRAWARNRALDAVRQNYTNASAHLFYAGALRDLGEQANVFNSEQLLARLLQPANLNTFNSFNNYTLLFEQPDTQGTASVALGNNETRAYEASVFGASSRFNLAYQGGIFYRDTDGWRDTNSENDHSYAGIVKWAPTDRDGFLFSASKSDLQREGLEYPRYEVDSPTRPDDKRDIDVKRFEVGYHRNLGARSDFLAVATRVSSDLDRFRQVTLLDQTSDRGNRFQVLSNGSTDARRDFDQAQLQLMHGIDKHQFIAGTLQLWGEDRDTHSEEQLVLISGGGQSLEAQVCVFGDCLPQSGSVDLSVKSYYLQDIWTVSPVFTLELAAYYTRVKDGDARSGLERTVDGFDPRIGLVFEPDTRNTLRLAAFRSLQPILSARIDPTVIAGIPVYRNDFPGTRHDVIAGAWEHQWGTGFAALNLAYRDIEAKPLEAPSGASSGRKRHGHRKSLEIDFNQLVAQRVGVFGRFRYLDVEDERFPLENRTERLFQAGFRYVRPNGFSAGVLQTFRNIDLPERDDESEQFAITDLDVAYELPDKAGLLQLGVFNLFDKQFNWVTDRLTLEGRAPTRELRVSISLNF